MIYQVAQYFIKLKPTMNGQIVDDSVDDMIIQVGDIVKKKSLNQITYDSDLQRWLFFLTSEETAQFNYLVDIQCIFVIDNNRIPTPVVRVDVKNSIIPLEALQ